MQKYHKYTEAEDNFILSVYKGKTWVEIRTLFNEKFNTNISYRGIREHGKEKLHLSSTYDRKGRKPWNKGVPMSDEVKEKIKATFFQKGRETWNRYEVGTEKVYKGENYILVKVAQPDVWRLKHHIEWEKYHPPLKKGEFLTFLDRNPQNCDISNLMLVKVADLAVMNKNKMWTDSAEINKSSLLLSKLIIKTSKLKRGKKINHVAKN